jgi:hypothetical protein
LDQSADRRKRRAGDGSPAWGEEVVLEVGCGDGAGLGVGCDREAVVGVACGGERALEVIVVGAGVSGCACAAGLASAGLRVTLVNSAMDRVGLPAYGPDVICAQGDWQRAETVLQALPVPLRQVWYGAASTPSRNRRILNVDRRKVSLESKRILERMPGLQFRQGFVTDIRLLRRDAGRRDVTTQGSAIAGNEDGRRVEVETIFGEVFQADAVVIAVGLTLGARSTAGDEHVQGGRYGEPDSEGLRAALENLGAEFRRTTIRVGPRVSAKTARALGWLREGDSDVLAEVDGWDRQSAGGEIDRPGLSEDVLVPLLRQQSDCDWPEGYPPSPHSDASLCVASMVYGLESPALSPDGVATGEVYVGVDGGLEQGMHRVTGNGVPPIASRLPMTVVGMVVKDLGQAGRMLLDGVRAPIWVIGRAAGASDYLDSLSSGLKAASDIAQVVKAEEARSAEIDDACRASGAERAGDLPRLRTSK